MDLLEGKDLRKRMLDSYSRDPKGWTFVVSPSPASGFFDATLSGPEEAWLLKVDSIFKPSPIVIGARAEPLRRVPAGLRTYGYRKVSAGLALKVMTEGVDGPETGARRELLSVLGSEPVVPEDGKSYAEGPMLLTGPGRVSLSAVQREIDDRLASEMRRLLKLRYPAYG